MKTVILLSKDKPFSEQWSGKCGLVPEQKCMLFLLPNILKNECGVSMATSTKVGTTFIGMMILIRNTCKICFLLYAMPKGIFDSLAFLPASTS